MENIYLPENCGMLTYTPVSRCLQNLPPNVATAHISTSTSQHPPQRTSHLDRGYSIYIYNCESLFSYPRRLNRYSTQGAELSYLRSWRFPGHTFGIFLTYLGAGFNSSTGIAPDESEGLETCLDPRRIAILRKNR